MLCSVFFDASSTRLWSAYWSRGCGVVACLNLSQRGTRSETSSKMELLAESSFVWREFKKGRLCLAPYISLAWIPSTSSLCFCGNESESLIFSRKLNIRIAKFGRASKYMLREKRGAQLNQRRWKFVDNLNWYSKQKSLGLILRRKTFILTVLGLKKKEYFHLPIGCADIYKIILKNRLDYQSRCLTL